MKSLAVIVLVLTIVSLSTQLTEEQQQKIKQNREECVKETGVDPVLIDKADQGDFSDAPKLKCFAKCFYQKAGFLNAQGEVLIDVVKEKIPAEANKEEALAIIEKCKELKGQDACETAFLIHKCYFENTHKKAAEPAPSA
uniref:Odorant-binding protein 3 n=1 Tax=Aethina tumida TaxID=116153 RepID=A0A6M3VZJ8_AETTU|nr:odorant-binding protein 3 [Aethina tumida]